MPLRFPGSSHRAGALLLAAKLTACAHTPPPSVPEPVSASPSLDEALPLPVPGPCALPPPKTFAPGGAEPLPIAQGRLEVVRIDGDARFDTGQSGQFSWSQDGSLLVTTSRQGLLVWDMVGGELRRAVPLTLDGERELKVNADASWAMLRTGWHGQSVRMFVRLDGTPGMYVRTDLADSEFSWDGRAVEDLSPDRKTLIRHDLMTGARTALPDTERMRALGDGVHGLIQVRQGTWEVREGASGRVVQRFLSPSTPLVAAKGSRIAFAGAWGLEVFDSLTGQRVHRLETIPQSAGGQPPHLALSPDSKRVAMWRLETSDGASIPDSSSLSVWELATGQQLWRQPLPDNGHDAEYLNRSWESRHLRYSVDGRLLLADVWERVQIHDAQTGEMRVPFDEEHRSARLAPDFRAIHERDILVPFPNTSSTPPRARLDRVLARSTDGSWTASLDDFARIQLEGPQGCTALNVQLKDEDTVAFSPDGSRFYAAMNRHLPYDREAFLFTPRVYEWRTTTVELPRVMQPAMNEIDGYTTAHVLPGAGRVVFSGSEGWRAVDVLSGAEVSKGPNPPVFREMPQPRGYFCCVDCTISWNPRQQGDANERLGREPVVGTREGRYLFARGDIHPSHPQAEPRINDRPQSPPPTKPFDERHLLRPSHLLERWDLERPGGIQETELDVEITTLALSPDERLVAAGLGNGGVFLMHPDMTERGLVTGLREKVVALAFSGDGRRLAAADPHGEVVVTDHERGLEVGRLSLRVDEVIHLWLSADGSELRVDTQRGLRITARLPPEARSGP